MWQSGVAQKSFENSPNDDHQRRRVVVVSSPTTTTTLTRINNIDDRSQIQSALDKTSRITKDENEYDYNNYFNGHFVDLSQSDDMYESYTFKTEWLVWIKKKKIDFHVKKYIC